MKHPSVTFRPIGVLRTPQTQCEATPIQPCDAADCLGRAALRAELAEGLADIEGFSHLNLVYWLLCASPTKMRGRVTTPSKRRAADGRKRCRKRPRGGLGAAGASRGRS
jgi:tRNA (Thr-GGU) A37 N-methylase